jgi:hypothetical protein
MSPWPSAKARRVFAALKRSGDPQNREEGWAGGQSILVARFQGTWPRRSREFQRRRASSRRISEGSPRSELEMRLGRQRTVRRAGRNITSQDGLEPVSVKPLFVQVDRTDPVIERQRVERRHPSNQPSLVQRFDKNISISAQCGRHVTRRQKPKGIGRR